MTHHILGIRHHGPGSAQAVREELERLKPDMVLVEGPPDGNEMIPWLAHPEMDLPVALLIYRPDIPQRATYYPFTTFSPELQALQYALGRDIPVQFADLPQAHQLASDTRAQAPDADPLIDMAKAAGFRSYEEWWNLTIEQRLDRDELFESILLLMKAMRQEAGDLYVQAGSASEPQLWAQRREAMMRRLIRRAMGEGKERIAIICGAWHAPSLLNLEKKERDDQLLLDMPQAEVAATWVPWTYGRLSFGTGYGAGILSPGWYHHLWTMSQQGAGAQDMAVGWLSRVAALLREQGLDASAAHVIQAVRLAEALAAIRDLPFPGLPELNDATVTVLCSGDVEPMQLIKRKLIICERLGMVPADTPMVPLQRDLIRLQRRLHLVPTPERTMLMLDLRKENNLERSQLLHRLTLLGISWGSRKHVRRQEGSSQETWQLLWQPDFAVRIIEASIWGNTVEEAASNLAIDRAQKAQDLETLTDLLDKTIMANLPQAISRIMTRVGEETAISSDIPHMMAALPPLARVLRYGSVRQTDQNLLKQIVDGLLTRICIGLPSTCASLDDEAAAEMSGHFTTTSGVIHTLRDQEHLQQWSDTMRLLVDQPTIHGLLAGRACRILLDGSSFKIEDAVLRMEQTLRRGALSQSGVEEAVQAAAWLDGFLQGSELLVVHDRQLWQTLDSWVSTLGEERFVAMLPLLRRTFSSMSQAARNQLHDRIRYGGLTAASDLTADFEFDFEQAQGVLPLVGQLLGLPRQTAVGQDS